MPPGLEMKYFVLKPRSKKPGDVYARASRFALAAYANEIKNLNPALASDIGDWIAREKALLAALWRGAGVDNWEGYDDAMQNLNDD